jgi:CRISPR-associated protein Cas2
MQQPDFYLIVYDIGHPRRLARVAKLMEQFGKRVQNSVFEAWLTRAELRQVMDRLQSRIDAEEDSVLIYYLCTACSEKKRKIGKSVVVIPPGVRIV